MAVLKMCKINICAMKKDRKKILELLQLKGCLEVHEEVKEDKVFEKVNTATQISLYERQAALTDNALEILEAKKNIRLIELSKPESGQVTVKKVSGGLLVQTEDDILEDRANYKVVTKVQPTEEQWKALEFAWKLVKHVKSNAILISNEKRTLGVGAGQMNRVGSAKIALEQAGEAAKGAVLASDAFFPFGDTVETAAKHGIAAIIQPGGSIRDEESIKAADEAGIAMVFTNIRHFKH